MITSFNLLGLTIHLYGLLIGVAMIVVVKISEWVLEKQKYQGEVIWETALWVVGFGLVGARIWHVATDWYLYQDNFISALYVWRGGMSILGGLVGGAVGLNLSKKTIEKYKMTTLTVSDALVIGLPFGQAIGRLGNWVNQELYGLPTNLPWKLYIDPEHRIAGYQDIEYFHPLFAYEAVILVVIGTILWKLSSSARYGLGKGVMTLLYLVSYALARFFLEFLRVDKTSLSIGLGVNQAILLLVSFVALYILFQRVHSLKR